MPQPEGRGEGGFLQRGYTLIELLVVMAVLGLLAAAVMPIAELTVQRERERELKRALWEVRDAIDAYKRAADEGAVPRGASGYPPSLEALAQGVPDARAASGRRVFLRRVPRDPFAPEGLEPARHWGLRSFASAPERPEPGEDVYDVYSRSERVGLNGVPLRQW